MLDSIFCIEGKEEKDRGTVSLGTLCMPKRNGEQSPKSVDISFLINSTKRESTGHWVVSVDHILRGSHITCISGTKMTGKTGP